MADQEWGIWHRPGGLREVLWLSFPMVISMASTTVLQVTDRLFLVQYSQSAMAAALPAGVLQWSMMSFFFGIAMYVNTFVAQYAGADRPQRIGAAVWQGVLLGLIATPILFSTIPFATWLFAFAGHDAQVQELEVEYFQLLMIGSPAQIMSAAISAFYSGRGNTRVVMYVNTFAAVLNAALDYLWIFGYGGFPRWGIAGAACATVLSYWIVLGVWLVLWLQPAHRRTYATWPSKLFDGELFRRLIRFGAPQGLQFVVEVGGFSLFLMIVGRLGATELAATGLALNVNSLAFMPVLGIAIAAETLVGKRIGEQQPDLAARSTWSAFTLALIYSLAIGAVYFFLGDALLFVHGLHSEDPIAFAATRRMTVFLLKFVALYCLFDCAYFIFSFAIKGAGDTRFVLKTTFVMSGLPVIAAWIGTEKFGLGIRWCWLVLTLWILSLGVIYLARFLAGHWREMQVIEHATIPAIGVVGDDDGMEPCVSEA